MARPNDAYLERQKAFLARCETAILGLAKLKEEDPEAFAGALELEIDAIFLDQLRLEAEFNRDFVTDPDPDMDPYFRNKAMRGMVLFNDALRHFFQAEVTLDDRQGS